MQGSKSRIKVVERTSSGRRSELKKRTRLNKEETVSSKEAPSLDVHVSYRRRRRLCVSETLEFEFELVVCLRYVSTMATTTRSKGPERCLFPTPRPSRLGPIACPIHRDQLGALNHSLNPIPNLRHPPARVIPRPNRASTATQRNAAPPPPESYPLAVMQKGGWT